jgi:hypothetical protein
MRGTQYAAAPRLKRIRFWNTGSRRQSAPLAGMVAMAYIVDGNPDART